MVVASRVVVGDSVVETDGGGVETDGSGVETDGSGKGVGVETPGLGAGEVLLVILGALSSGGFSLG